jgi:ribosomal protein S18 acetylase RimI-like enzyme
VATEPGPITFAPPDVALRAAKSEDHDPIGYIHRITHEEHVAREADYPYREPFSNKLIAGLSFRPHWLRRILYRVRSACLVAEAGGEVIGYAFVRRMALLDLPGLLYILDISIRPDWRGRGVGRRLLDRIEADGRGADVGTILADIWPGNAASRALFDGRDFNVLPGRAPVTVPGLLRAEKSLTVPPRMRPVATVLGMLAAISVLWLLATALTLVRLALTG